MVEPCASGAWHIHAIIIFNDRHKVLSTDDVTACWLKGYSDSRYVDNARGLAKYFEVAEISEEEAAWIGYENLSIGQVKGLRAKFYPTGTHLYRVSRGIKRPTKQQMTYGEAKENIGTAQQIGKTDIALIDEWGNEVNRLHREESLK